MPGVKVGRSNRRGTSRRSAKKIPLKRRTSSSFQVVSSQICFFNLFPSLLFLSPSPVEFDLCRMQSLSANSFSQTSYSESDSSFCRFLLFFSSFLHLSDFSSESTRVDPRRPGPAPPRLPPGSPPARPRRGAGARGPAPGGSRSTAPGPQNSKSEKTRTTTAK